ncbi:hypothetical protein EGJ23_12065 [Pseudomonas sp. o96-267]|nr:hypothetical protein EGJ23_12065 [Pseudomonas sp. o96-267]
MLAGEQSLYCHVVGVSDGDTMSCFDPERRKAEKIRLRGIYAPESKLPSTSAASRASGALGVEEEVALCHPNESINITPVASQASMNWRPTHVFFV